MRPGGDPPGLPRRCGGTLRHHGCATSAVLSLGLLSHTRILNSALRASMVGEIIRILVGRDACPNRVRWARRAYPVIDTGRPRVRPLRGFLKRCGASGKPRPTNALIPKHISSIKRFTNKQAGFDMWQDSYHDHIIRNDEEYRVRWQYIDNNPAKWAEDDYFVKGEMI